MNTIFVPRSSYENIIWYHNLVRLFESPSDTSIDAPDILLIIEEEVDLYYINFLSSFVQVQKIQDEEIAHSIRVCESLLDETPYTVVLDVFEKFDFSCLHVAPP